MIKKVLITLSLVITIITSNNLTETKAVEGIDIEWISYNYYADVYGLRGDVYFNEGLHSVNFIIPETQYNTLETDGIQSFISFYDIDDTLLVQYDWVDLFGYSVTGFFDLDFRALEIDPSCVRMRINVMQTYGVTPGGYIDYVDANDKVNIYYDQPTYRDVYFERGTFGGNPTVSLTYYDIPYNSYAIFLDFSNVNNYMYVADVGGYNAALTLLDDTPAALDSFNLKDYAATNEDQIYIEFPFDTYTVNSIDVITLVLFVENNDFEYIDKLNRNFKLAFNENIVQVEFYSLNVLYDSDIIISGERPDRPTDPTPPTGFEFLGWFNEDGTGYYFTTLTKENAINDNYRVYAKYQAVGGSAGTPNTTDPTPDETTGLLSMATSIGFGSTAGLVAIYGGFLIIVVAGLIIAGSPMLVVDIIALLITIMFSYLGFLPLFITMLAIVVIVAAFVMQMFSNNLGRM